MLKTLKACVLVCVLSAAVLAGDMNGPPCAAPPPPTGSSSVTTAVVVSVILSVLGIR
jgi:hypothetical protein